MSSSTSAATTIHALINADAERQPEIATQAAHTKSTPEREASSEWA
jgi:hypothetical protein